MKENPEIPEHQYAGIGRLVVSLLKEHKGDWPVTLTVSLLDYKRTLDIADGNRHGEITVRYPVV